MTKHSGLIDLMSPEQGHSSEVIILASPQRPGEMCNRDGVNVDSNNLMAQFQAQSNSQEAQECQQVDAVPAGRKRMWGDMDDGEHQQRVARQMMWGSTGPRMHRSRTALLQAPQGDQQPSAKSDDVIAAATLPRKAAPCASRRRLTVVPHKQQLPAAAAAAGADSPAIVIDDDSPIPSRAQQQQQAIIPATNSRPAPAAIQGNPRYGSRAPGAASTTPAAQHPRRRMRASVIWDSLHEGVPAEGATALASRDSRHTNDHSGSSSDDAEVARRAQEQEDAELARRMMQEEQLRAQTEAAEHHRRRLELMRQIDMQEAAAEAAEAAAVAAVAAATAQAGSPGRGRGRRAYRAPQRAAHLQQQQHQAHQQPHQHNPHWGMAMAHALLQLPRWGGGRGRGLPPGLSAMREAVLGMQAAGLPPHLLFSDRDFGADDYDMLLRLDETVQKKGAERVTIDALPTQTVPAGGISGTAGEKMSCAVCLEEYAEGAELRTLPCLHKFHKGCIDKWLGVKAACPVCNRECK